MIDARVFVNNLDGARAILEKEEASLKGRYAIHDTIYRNIDRSIQLVDEFLRLRDVPENIWDEKRTILALKQTEIRKIGKSSHIPIKLEFDSREEAKRYYDQYLRDRYINDFDFWRIGWQYILLNGDVVDLEIIEGEYNSIELKSSTDGSLEKLLVKFSITSSEIITGPSVVAIRELLTIADE